MKNKTKIALVLSGGGARGAYQIGAWQALLDMDILPHIRAFYGTSVGAINAAVMIQEDLDLAKEIWSDLDYKKVFTDHPGVRPSFAARRQYFQWVRGVIRNRGVDVTPLKSILRSSLDEDLIRSSDCDFGLVVFDLINRKPQYLKKKEIPIGQLTEYVIASSTFPIFQPHRIEDQSFIDGGVYDNRPVDFVRESEDIDLVIVIDVTMARHIWRQKRMPTEKKVIYLRPSRLLGSPLAFQKDRINANMELGYTDALIQLEELSSKL
jgi:Predicted esterase of the alpha-beta hydrolase superfamily